VKRREFIAGIGSAAACSVAARAQQGERLRRIGWLIPEGLVGAKAGTCGLIFASLSTIQNGFMMSQRSLLTFRQEVIIAGGGGPLIQALQQRTQIIPIVFAGGQDPVSIDLVRNIARPEGNITGFGAMREIG
jgi:putative ABC transport system substrate-binding protein